MDFGCALATFDDLLGHFFINFGTQGHRFTDLGSPGTSHGSPWGPDLEFCRLLMDFGSLLGATLGNFRDFFTLWDTKVALWVPGWVFNGSGDRNRSRIPCLDVLKPW